MKLPLILAAGLCLSLGLSLGACTDIGRIVGGNPQGNPNDDAYAGKSGSVYDVSANPPRANGMSKYDPYAPLPEGSNPATPMATPAPAAPAATPRHQL